MHDPHDDLDTLFARTPVPPPADVGGRARARFRAIRAARRLTAVAALDLLGLFGLAVVAYLLGSAVSNSSLPAVAEVALEDWSLAVEARREIALAVVDEMPWHYVAALALNALALCGLTAYLLRATDAVVPSERREAPS